MLPVNSAHCVHWTYCIRTSHIRATTSFCETSTMPGFHTAKHHDDWRTIGSISMKQSENIRRTTRRIQLFCAKTEIRLNTNLFELGPNRLWTALAQGESTFVKADVAPALIDHNIDELPVEPILESYTRRRISLVVRCWY